MIFEKCTIAAFDFDGTLTERDALWPFLCFCCGWKKASFSAMRTFPSLLCYCIGLKTRQEVKETLLTHCLRGLQSSKLKALGKSFAAGPLSKYLRPTMIDRLLWHKNQGHRCVLISANLDLFLQPWSTVMGLEACLCSQLAVDECGVITGRLQGLNCWGPEKPIRLEKLLEGRPRNSYTLYAYGDSRGDSEMLAAADYPTYVKELSCPFN